MKKIVSNISIRYILMVSSLMLVLFLTSCFDLGTFSEGDGYEKYYSSLGDVIGKYDDNGSLKNLKYDVEKSLFNKQTVDYFSWEDEDDAVEYQKYNYIVIPFKGDFKIESLALFVAADKNDLDTDELELEFSAFYYPDSASLPDDDNIKLLSSPDTRKVTVQDENGNEIEVDEEIEYADPQKNLSVCSAKFTATSEWKDGFIFDSFTTPASVTYVNVVDNCLVVEDGSYLYIRVENNSGLNRTTLKSCSISFMNLLIKAF